MNGAALHRHAVGAPSTTRNSGRLSPRLMRSSRTVRQASALSPSMLLIASNTFLPTARTPRTTSSEIEVALRLSRTRTTVAVEDHAHDRILDQRADVQASQSLFTLRHVRLTVSLPTVPPNSAASADVSALGAGAWAGRSLRP